MTEKPSKRRWIGPALILVTIVAAAGLGVFSLMLASWSQLKTADPADAEQAFAQALADCGGGPAYIDVSDAGVVAVLRELEGEQTSLTTLHALAWRPQDRQLIHIAFPFWFVRMKMSSSVNLGTLSAALARDWDHLDLDVTEDDLELRGPGLVLDETGANGERLMLWTD